MNRSRWLGVVLTAVMAALVVLGMRAGDEDETRSMTLNALDYRLSLYDLKAERHGSSRQLDDQLREYVGDVLFDGESLHILETER